MNNLLITGGRLIDPASNLDDEGVVFIKDGVIEYAGCAKTAQQEGIVDAAMQTPDIRSIDATGMVVTPGLIDMHVHFREPGMEEEETIASGAASAAAGGFTSVACMPNTDPALDSEAHMNFVNRESRKAGKAEVYPVGAITAGRAGEEISEMANMVRGGAVAFSDDGCSVASTGVLKQAMLYAKMLGKPVLEHCDEPDLAEGGVMNEGFVSTTLGLPAIPAEAEEIIVSRDILLARLTGAHLHVQHISTKGSVELVRNAKKAGINVTAEVCPHHLTLTEEKLRTFDPVYKVAPPLRGEDDVNACIEALADGTIDVIASDHAPHLREEKELELAYAPCGLIGLESSVGVLFTYLIHTGKLTLPRMIEALTTTPAKILGLERGALTKGATGNVTIINPEQSWTVDPTTFFSRSRNCPWAGEVLKGRATYTIVEGEVVWEL